MKSKKRLFRTAFTWGRNEHYLESLTNALFLAVIIFAWSNYFGINPIKNTDEFILSLLTLCFAVHILARFCHKKERKYHRRARKKT